MIDYTRRTPKNPPAESGPINYNRPGRPAITKMSPLGSENSVRLTRERPTIVISR